MPHYCCAGECNNHSECAPKHVSFHKLPLEDKKLLKVWITKIRRDPRYFSPNMHTKICIEHFKEDDFIFADASKRRLKAGVIPSVFKWTKKNGSGDVNREETTFGSEYKARSGDTNRLVVIDKLNTSGIEEEEATDAASEGEGEEVVGRPSFVSRKTQTSSEDCPKQPRGKSHSQIFFSFYPNYEFSWLYFVSVENINFGQVQILKFTV